MHSFGSSLRQWGFWKELISFRSLVIVSPIFLLTVKHWTNLVVLIVFVGSLFFWGKGGEMDYESFESDVYITMYGAEMVL